MINENRSKTGGSSAKYKLATSEKLGRYLVAAKDVAAGEVILREEPVAVGPMNSGRDYFCFDCLRVLPEVKQGAQYVCRKCNIAPLCGSACEEQSKCHTSDECEMFRNCENFKTKDVMEVTDVLLPLRLWFLKRRKPDTWKRIISMENHADKRRNTAIWNNCEVNVVNVIRDLCLIPEGETFSPEFLQQLCGILDVNTFEVRSPGGLDCLLLRGLYVEASFMAHDCRGNTHLTVDDNFQLTVYAALPIKENEPILFNYTSSLLGTSDRREHLRGGKYFECDCSMCKDPYELGAHLSTILCPRCRTGFVGVQDPLTNNVYSKVCRWQCNMCRRTYGGRLINATLNISKVLIDDVDDSDIKGMESLIKKLSRSLHPNHYLLLSLKQKLLAAYRREVTSLNPARKTFQKMLDMCNEVYKLLEIIEPGISRLKGIMLYEMHLPQVLLANRIYGAREISEAELASRLAEAAGLLKKSLTMLLLEPVNTPEGKLAKRALQELKALNQNIADVKAMASSAPENSRPHHKKRAHKN